ncbi:TonB-dependent receptor [Chryseobacterium angstadtii]|uniref:TonB-dependent receptor n=1 Tax=Chryseobacterium angstadtii TaxID=558151 RepID=UPI00069D7C09|nr:TonB-dependent receptor [Chryseobacterium angstadtii]
MKKRVLLIAFQFVILSVSGQTVTGIVVAADSKKPVSGVKVGVENTGIWALTDNSGLFKINYNADETLVFSRSGLLEERKTYVTLPTDMITVEMQAASIRIREIALAAKKKNFSQIEIKEEALQKIQAFSIGDVLQQLPGQYIQPISNTEMKNIIFRTANSQSVIGTSENTSDFGNKAFGTQLMINDVEVSNNGNMQNYNSPYGDPFGQITYPFSISTNKGNLVSAKANYGIDLRQIPTDDIEKIEVIAGIPDAKYGDLTSGLIKVETKAGERPLQLLTSIVEGTYQFGASKGFRLNERGDAINVSLNYMNSEADPRMSDVTYERYTGNMLWSTSGKSKRWKNKLGLNISTDLNEGQAGEDEYNGIYIKARNKTFSLSNNSSYRFKDNAFIKSINSNFGVSYSEQSSMRRNFINSQGRPYGTALTDSVYYGEYTLPQYFNSIYVDGQPFNIFADIDANSVFKTENKWIHNVSFGLNYRYNDNFGKGRSGTVGQFAGLSSVGDQSDGTRDYNYRDNVFSMSQFAVYAQDNIIKKFNKDFLLLNVGLRYDMQNKASTVSPRLNASYSFNNIFTLRGGTGLSTKAPSLSMLYTGPRYIDLLLGDYRLPGVYSVAIVQTLVTPANNIDLKPSKSWRSEIGFDWRLPFVNAGITGYYNRLYDGFTTYQNIAELQKAKVDVTVSGTSLPTFQVLGTEQYRVIQALQTNGYDSVDKGLEMLLNFKKIEMLNLSIGVKGSYVETKSNKTVETLAESTIKDPQVAYGVFSPYQQISKLSRAGLMLDYHIPKAGLIISLNTDHFLLDERRSEGDKLPIAYLDQNLVRHEVTTADLNNQTIKSMKNAQPLSVYSLDGRTFHNFHLRVTKDFLSGIRISVYLNNMFNLKVYNNNGYAYTNFTPISFGGNLSYKF